jgi:DNA-binding CsgD family transcriptional regulator/predicted ester cyclase
MAADPSPDSSAIDYKQLVRRWINEVWNNRREEVIDEMMSPDCIVQLEGVDGGLTPEAFKEYRRSFIRAVPDIYVEILSITSDGNVYMWTWRVTGTHLGPGLGIPPSGKRVDFTGATYCEFSGELIVHGFDRWNRGEFIASLMQVRMDELREHAALTAREAQVALLMGERLTHVEIASELKIMPNTARRHCEKVLLKLGISRRQDVAGALGKIPGSVLTRHGSDLQASRATV